MVYYKAYVVYDLSTMNGWWKYPRRGGGYKTMKGLIKSFYRPLSDYGLIEVWKFHGGVPSRDGGVPWFAPELVETYVKGVKQ